MLYEGISTIEDPGSLRGGLGPDATDGERPMKTGKIEMRAPAGGQGFDLRVGRGVRVEATRVTDILTDTVKQIVADTLSALGWRPAPDLNIYPNPVPRGGAIQLAWAFISCG
jgi:hypothetical protein